MDGTESISENKSESHEDNDFKNYVAETVGLDEDGEVLEGAPGGKKPMKRCLPRDSMKLEIVAQQISE